MARKTVPAKRAKKKAAPAKRPAVVAQRSSELDQVQKSLEGLSVAALREVIESATDLIEQKTEGVKRSFIEEVTARAVSLGLSVTDLFSRSTPPAAVKKAAPVLKAGGKRASPGAKYRNPETGEERSGRGRPARWIVTAEAAGKKRESFAV